MKRFISILLCLVLALSAFSGCGPKETIKESLLKDVKVRQALWYAIDFKTITETLWDGAVTAAPKSLVPPGDWQAPGLTDYSYNPTKAKELLKEAKWNSKDVLQCVYYTGNLADSITAIQSYWAAVGVKMEFKLLTDNLSVQLWTPPADRTNGPSAVDWDICFAGINALCLSEFYERNSSTAGNNSSIPLDAKLDALIAESAKAVTVEEQKKAFNNIQIYLNEQAYVMPMFYLPNWVVTSDKLDMKGNKPGADQYSYEKNILDWTINREDKTMYTNTGAVGALEHTATNPGLFWHQEIVFDRLLNATGSLVPSDGLLAESYTVSADGKSYEFKLRDGIKWHDGKPFTAEDVKWSLEYYPKVPGANGVMSPVLKNIKNIKIDGQKVTVEFNSIQPNALTIFAQWPILPKHLLENVTPEKFTSDLFWQHPIGTGPFKVKEVKLNEYTVLERNKDYFLPGTGNIELIHMSPSDDKGDLNLIVNAQAGKIDYAFVKDAKQIAQLKGISGMSIEKIDVTFPRCVFFNMYPREIK